MTHLRQWLKKIGITEHPLFLAGMILKGADGLVEFCAGIVALVMGAAYLKHIVWLWAIEEVAEESGNALASHIASIAHDMSNHTATFAAMYLLLHGALKLGLVIGMIRRIRWVYPLAATVLLAFIGYQIYRITQHFSVVLLSLTCIDALIVVLILREYMCLPRSASAPEPSFK